MSEKKTWIAKPAPIAGTETRGTTPQQVSEPRMIPLSGTQPAQSPAAPAAVPVRK